MRKASAVVTLGGVALALMFVGWHFHRTTKPPEPVDVPAPTPALQQTVPPSPECSASKEERKIIDSAVARNMPIAILGLTTLIAEEPDAWDEIRTLSSRVICLLNWAETIDDPCVRAAYIEYLEYKLETLDKAELIYLDRQAKGLPPRDDTAIDAMCAAIVKPPTCDNPPRVQFYKVSFETTEPTTP